METPEDKCKGVNELRKGFGRSMRRRCKVADAQKRVDYLNYDGKAL